MWPGISEAGSGWFRFLNARTVEIVGRGLSKILQSPQSVSEIRTDTGGPEFQAAKTHGKDLHF